jgi:NADPH:quinone reductase-like Zn-dependent oxidoreductase
VTRSVRIHEFGGPDVLRIEDVMFQEPNAGEVRLRIHAIGLNRTELTLRAGPRGYSDYPTYRPAAGSRRAN